MLNKFIPANFNLAVTFGKYKLKLNRDTGVSEPAFVPEIGPIMAMAYKRTVYQTLVANVNMPNSRQIVIYHNPQVDESLTCQIDGKFYRIIQVDPDDSAMPNAFDIIYLEQETTVKGDDSAD